jgi:hypothetical protein
MDKQIEKRGGKGEKRWGIGPEGGDAEEDRKRGKKAERWQRTVNSFQFKPKISLKRR